MAKKNYLNSKGWVVGLKNTRHSPLPPPLRFFRKLSNVKYSPSWMTFPIIVLDMTSLNIEALCQLNHCLNTA